MLPASTNSSRLMLPSRQSRARDARALSTAADGQRQRHALLRGRENILYIQLWRYIETEQRERERENVAVGRSSRGPIAELSLSLS